MGETGAGEGICSRTPGRRRHRPPIAAKCSAQHSSARRRMRRGEGLPLRPPALRLIIADIKGLSDRPTNSNYVAARFGRVFNCKSALYEDSEHNNTPGVSGGASLPFLPTDSHCSHFSLSLCPARSLGALLLAPSHADHSQLLLLHLRPWNGVPASLSILFGPSNLLVCAALRQLLAFRGFWRRRLPLPPGPAGPEDSPINSLQLDRKLGQEESGFDGLESYFVRIRRLFTSLRCYRKRVFQMENGIGIHGYPFSRLDLAARVQLAAV